MQPDALPTLIILAQREHQRLKNQARRLSAGTVPEHDLRTYRSNWVAHLGFEAFLPPLLSAMDDLLDGLAQGQATEAAYEEVAFQIGIYQKGTWGFIRHFYGSVSPYVDRWLKVLPAYKEAFTRRYEAHGKLSVAEQGTLIRALIAAIPNKDDPYRLRQGPQGKTIPGEPKMLGAAREQGSKPKAQGTTGKVADFLSLKNRRC